MNFSCRILVEKVMAPSLVLGVVVEETGLGCRVIFELNSKKGNDADGSVVLYRCVQTSCKIMLLPCFQATTASDNSEKIHCFVLLPRPSDDNPMITLASWSENMFDIASARVFKSDSSISIFMPRSVPRCVEDRSNLLSLIPEPLSSQTWKHACWTGICCKSCGQTIVPRRDELRVLDLPSENWMEFVDCWVCHEDQDLFVKKVSFDEPKENQILVGREKILVSPQLLLLADQHGNDGGKEGGYVDLICSCGSCWGRKRMDGVKVVELDKTALKISMQDPDLEPLTCTHEGIISHQILDQIMSHSIYRFSLHQTAAAANTPPLFLKAVNWDLVVSFPIRGGGLVNNSHESTSKPFRAIKCVAGGCESEIVDPKTAQSTQSEALECQDLKALSTTLSDLSFMSWTYLPL